MQVLCQSVVSSPVSRRAGLKWELTGSHLERGYGVNAEGEALCGGKESVALALQLVLGSERSKDQRAGGKPFRV